ncbi:hypothetical protein IJI72_02560 [Candidatus Saccharibacteria bacterium]|nr:hypothetical protein [Candidatus Saccharibacteria bacterium]
MKIVVVYKPYSDHGSETEDWMRELLKRGEGKVEVRPLNPETKEGEGFCQAHGILDYPAVVVVGEDGKDYFATSGKPLPTFNEVMSFLV